MPIADILAVNCDVFFIFEADIRRYDQFVRFGPIADIATSPDDVRFTPNSGHSRVRLECPDESESFQALGCKTDQKRRSYNQWLRDVM